jgi:hypothetical protein
MLTCALTSAGAAVEGSDFPSGGGRLRQNLGRHEHWVTNKDNDAGGPGYWGLGAFEACRDHRGAILGIRMGDEIPTDVVRVHGIPAVQDQHSELGRHLHDSERSLLATYEAFPPPNTWTWRASTSWHSMSSWNAPGELARYVAHLHVIADDRPVVISELGLAEVVHGVERQAEFLDAHLAEVEAMERPAPSSSMDRRMGCSSQPIDD